MTLSRRNISRVVFIVGCLTAVILALSDSEARPAATDVPPGSYRVVQTIDGDTLDVLIDGTKQRIRMIGVDTPETKDPRKGVQCFGKEASAYTKQTLEHEIVKLEADPTQDQNDKYGRLLRYVILVDGTNFNQMLIREGYAYEYTYGTPYQYQEAFKRAERDARNQKRGLWADDACVSR